MMHDKFVLGSLLVTLGLVSACSGGDVGSGEVNGGPVQDEGVSAAEETGTNTATDLITELEVEGVSHRFVDLGDSVAISMHGPDSRKPVALQLLEEHGDLTTLELFLAMAPNDASVDARLIASHDVEATALNRSDTDVRTVELDTLIEKGSEQNCRNWAAGKRGGFPTTIGSSPSDDSTLTMAVARTGIIVTAVCNTSWSSSDSGLAGTVERKIGFGPWTQIGSSGDDGDVFILPANANASDSNSWAFISPATATSRRLRVNGFFLGAGHIFYLAIAY